jgi:hypothetical protein
MNSSVPPSGTQCHLHGSLLAGVASRRFLIITPKNEEPRRAAKDHRGQSSLMRHDLYAAPPPATSSSC